MITIRHVQEAKARLKEVSVRTPLLKSASLSTPHETVWFKPENLQPIGSFKIRGAYNRLAAMTPAERAQGVIAYSSGNHAQGVAYAAQRLGVKAIVVMPDNASKLKIEQTKHYGAQVVLYNPEREKREAVAAKLMAGKKYTLIPPFNDPFVIAGQATAGLEILEELPTLEMVIVPVGGGGLISGVATAIKTYNSGVKIIGVEPELANDAQRSFRSGRIVELPAKQTNQTIADGVRTLAVGELTFEHMRALVDDIVTVTEAEIMNAARHILLTEKLVSEPTGALPLAAWQFHRDQLPRSKQTVLMISGANMDHAILQQIIGSGS
jgi:threonine dehydratase